MNKKITAVTLTAIMVLTMFTAMVPAASAAIEVTAPYEFLGAVNQTPTGNEFFKISATSRMNPGLLFYDLDDEDGDESLDILTFTDDEQTVTEGNLTYTTTLWDEGGYQYVSWLGSKYRVAENGSGEWVISEELVDEDDDDDHLLRVGESLSLPEGFGITAMEIDVDGEEAWLSLTKDGEEIENEVVSTKTGEDHNFVYEDDFDEADDVEIMNFTVETVFAGMNTNLVKIHSISLVSMDLQEVDGGSDEPFADYRTNVAPETITITNEEDISLNEDGTVGILDDQFIIRVNEHGTLAALGKEITERGIHEILGAVNQTPTGNVFFYISATSKNNPSILFYDIDDEDGDESLDILTFTDDEQTVTEGNLTYTTTLWEDSGYKYVSWLGSKYRVAENGSGEWVISEELVDEDDDDDHLLRVGESLSLPEGFGITAMEIDVDGEEAWLSLTKDGEEIENEVVSTKTGEDHNFVYEDDFDEADDVEIMNFTVETVFAGMNTNLVKIHSISLVSMDLQEVDGGSDEPFADYRTNVAPETITITNEEDISLNEDGTVGILDDQFIVRVNEHGTLAGLAKEISIGGPVPTPTTTATPVETPAVNVTVAPTEGVTGTGTAPPTATAAEIPTEKPTKVPGFEAAFAVAGLLAVAYLVLRQRE